MDLTRHISAIRQDAKRQKEFNNFKAMSLLRQALMVKGMTPAVIAKFMGKLNFAITDEVVRDPRFADYMTAHADNLLALYNVLQEEFGDDQVFVDLCAKIHIAL